LAGTWRVIPHPEGEWLIETDKGRVAVVPALGRMLSPFDGEEPSCRCITRQLEIAGWSAERDGPASEVARGLQAILSGEVRTKARGTGQALWVRGTLVPAILVRRLAGSLRGWASAAMLVAQTAMGLAGYAWAAFHIAGMDVPRGAHLFLGPVLFFLTAVWHELGHAAALARGGYPPGRIGLGILFIVPVLFADVSAVSALSRRDRLRVDLAGVCFQLGAGGILVAGGSLLGWGGLVVAGGLALAAVLWSLLPFIRADGYWALADVLQLESLEKPAPAGRSSLVRVFLLLHRTANGLFLLVMGLWVPLRLYRLAMAVLQPVGISPYLILLPVVAFTAMAWRGIIRRLAELIYSNRKDWREVFGC
jgi:hypothetical protein